MTREHKYTIGIDIKHDAMDLLRQIYKANHHRDKAPYLDDFLAVLELIKLQLRICHDINALSLRKITQLALMLDKVAKQATAWKKHEIKQLKKEEKEEETTPNSMSSFPDEVRESSHEVTTADTP